MKTNLSQLGILIEPLLRSLCALCVALALCGCATLSQEPLFGAGGSASAQKSLLVEFVAQGAAGAQKEINDPTQGRITVTVGATYISALGETCRKATVQAAGKDATPEFTAVCQAPDRKWRELPQVLAPGSAHKGQR